MKTRKPMKLMLVEWIDSHSGDAWQPLDQMVSDAAQPVLCRSVGWLAAKTKTNTVIVPHLSGEDSGNTRVYGCGEISIPNKAITKTRVLR